ncbi:MAG: class I SAM-dependent methyltransferase [Leptospirillia bacterium]
MAESLTSSTQEVARQLRMQSQGAMSLNVAFIGIVSNLFEALHLLGEATIDALAKESGMDTLYVRRWAEAAYAFGYLDLVAEHYKLTFSGNLMRPSHPETQFNIPIGALLSAHMADRAAELMLTGERPGEKVLTERKNILPWFGAMLEASFSGIFEKEICPSIKIFSDIDQRGGTVVDLGCGNGWYLRSLARRCQSIRGIGLDGFEENVRRARNLAKKEGLDRRLSFDVGDIKTFSHTGTADIIAMNRALHHVWDEKETVFRILKDHLKPDGAVVIWEPAWPQKIQDLREPRRRPLAVQNLGEHVQGNHLLRPEEIVDAFRAVGMKSEVSLFGEGTEAVIVGFHSS